ncbi:MAG: A/G-specific adenine glycosylase [Crocinitomicaceae bacterium]|jgi:A/G-specific adenine glycosylase
MQQTRVEQGTAYYEKFTANYPTIIDLANAEEQQILNDWQGLGYYSRARNLHYSAKLVRDDFNGEFPKTFNEILKLKGVGTYTAAAISSFAFKEKKAVVDGNVYRLLSRVFDIDTPIDSSKGQKEFQIVADELIPAEAPDIHNQAIMEVGALVCTPKKPNCEACPLVSLCLARVNQTIESRPVKSKKTKVRDRFFHFFLYNTDGETYVEQRTEKGIWQNMFQFPLVEIESKDIDSVKNQWKDQWKESSEIIHKLSHQTIHGVFHHFDSAPKSINDSWIKIKMEDIQDYPLPRIIDRYLEENA